MKIGINNHSSQQEQPIHVKLITYRMKWDNTKDFEESSEEKTFNNLDELRLFASGLSKTNDKFRMDAKKNKASYYLAQFIENI